MDANAKLLDQMKKLIDNGLTTESMMEALKLIGAYSYTPEILESFMLWTDYMPLSETEPYTEEQRYLHILWEELDRVPLGLSIAFALPVRQMIGKKLFKRCGKHFISQERNRFNFGTHFEVGNDIHLNHGNYFDTKGRIVLDDFAMLADDSKFWSHGHDKYDHRKRQYFETILGKHCAMGSNVTIMPGVKIGEGAVVASGALVTHDVPPYTMAVGVPAKVTKEIDTNGLKGCELDEFRVYLKDGAFQLGTDE